jgi:hypothetical protein
LVLWPALAGAQASKAGTVTALQGQATVARATLATPVALRFPDDVFVRDRIETGERSVARVLLGGKAIVTIRELSVFTVTEEPGRAVVELTKGKLALGVAKKLMQPGESVEIRGPNVAAAVRGSYLTFAVGTVGGTPSSTVAVLEESQCIPVWVLDDPTRTVCLSANETVEGVGSNLGLPRSLTAEEARREAQAGEAPRPDALDVLPPGLAPPLRREVLQLATVPFTLSGVRPPLFTPPQRPPVSPVTLNLQNSGPTLTGVPTALPPSVGPPPAPPAPPAPRVAAPPPPPTQSPPNLPDPLPQRPARRR